MSFGSGVVTLIHSCCEVVWYSHGMEQTSFGKGCEAEMRLQIHCDQLQVGCEAEMQLRIHRDQLRIGCETEMQLQIHREQLPVGFEFLDFLGTAGHQDHSASLQHGMKLK